MKLKSIQIRSAHVLIISFLTFSAFNATGQDKKLANVTILATGGTIAGAAATSAQ